jgi:hypothetical protein
MALDRLIACERFGSLSARACRRRAAARQRGRLVVSGIHLRSPGRYAHGTRARYVAAKCRCAECRAANTAYYHLRQARAKALAAELPPAIGHPGGQVAQMWTAPDGTKRERWYKRACPGPGNGIPCPRDAHLRKDSKGGCCGVCRELLVWNGDVDARDVRAHLRKLSRAGVGYRAVAEACDVSKTVLLQVLTGKKHAIRKRTADRVLGITKDAAADHACIPAGPTWKLLEEIRERGGLTKGDIAERLGLKTPALQIRKTRVLASTALRVRRLHAQVMAEIAEEQGLPTICDECGYSHEPAARRAVVLRMLPCTSEELREAHPCWWSGPNGSARLSHDLRGVGAARLDGVWARREAAPAATSLVQAEASAA